LEGQTKNDLGNPLPNVFFVMCVWDVSTILAEIQLAVVLCAFVTYQHSFCCLCLLCGVEVCMSYVLKLFSDSVNILTLLYSVKRNSSLLSQ